MRDAVAQSDQRAAAAERRALLEVEQERQARSKAEKQTESLRGQMASLEAQERQKGLANAEAVARLQGQLEALQSTAQRQGIDNESLQRQVEHLRNQLQASQQDAIKFRAEAEAVQALVKQLSQGGKAKSSRTKSVP